MNKLTIIKVGGKIVEAEDSLQSFLDDFAAYPGKKILVHGGGTMATEVAAKLGIATKMVEGRRITDADMLKVAIMVYGGLVNKNIVAALQARDVNALGLTGADLNIIQSVRRPVGEVDYGFVGDVEQVDDDILYALLKANAVPVCAPITHDKNGQLLNTNADTIASSLAVAMSGYYKVRLIYCFEKKGVLKRADDDDSVLDSLNFEEFEEYVEQGIIKEGMVPKLKNGFDSLDAGVEEVVITNSGALGFSPLSGTYLVS